MNMWGGVTPDFLDVLEEGFKEFFENLDAGTQDKILYVLKTEITPKKEIDKAKILRKEYYGSKNK